ncbi:putative transcription regulator mTERF family [Rosa chinensis]|uniref:Putative transcription regulator mTERF family n=1 Tax=Rosa chinensis TaxID=74649 RepID=A0A2P6RYA3_ROSCH|nr:transcription termination factor MTERF15, mitochondrial [Rosa chinensis]PRQ51419.1 putative transcription regulator mTERF family [Rosa chinensis]
MFGVYCKRLQLLVPTSVTHFHCFQKFLPFSRSYSSLLGSDIDDDDDKPQGHSFTVSYLINSFGFSPKLALSLSNKHRVRFDSPEKPDSVVKLLKHHGFNGTQISEIVKKLPTLLLCNAEKTLEPKLQFFDSIGLSATALAWVVSYNRRILGQSLERSLRPCYDIIKSLPIPDNMVAVFLKNSNRAFGVKMLSNLVPNVSVLRAIQVPESCISFYVTYHPLVLSPETSKFKESVNKIINLGILPPSFTFMKALQVISQMDASKWRRKTEFYRKCGWTEDDFLLAFRKNPMFMSLSEEKSSSKIEFLVNKMGWQPAEVADRPDILTHSLEKSIIPRCSVIRVLQYKGLMKKGELSQATMLINSRKRFLDRFVTKYQDQAPELLSIFQGQMSLAELGVGFEERDGVKQL